MPIPQRIVSLLPSATEICFALGLGDRLVGVSHECDFPSEVRGTPAITAPKIDPQAPSVEIDRQVRSLVAEGLSIYRIDEKLLRALRPDLILTQDVCDVCAVPLAEVREATCRLLGSEVEILSLSPRTLTDVFEDVRRVGVATATEAVANELVGNLQVRLDCLRTETSGLKHPTVLVLDWLDPPMVASHWTPELIRIAGGHPVLGREAEPSGPIEWQRVVEAAPDVLLVIPCGFRIRQSLRELPRLMDRQGIGDLPAVRSGQVAVIDGSAYFNRPGPRLVDSAELAAQAIHPGHFGGRFKFGQDALVRWPEVADQGGASFTAADQKGETCFQRY